MGGYLRIAEVAAHLRRSERTAWTRVARAGVPRYRDAAGRTLIAVSDLPALDAPVPVDPA